MGLSLIVALYSGNIICPNCSSVITATSNYNVDFMEIKQIGFSSIFVKRSEEVTLYCNNCNWSEHTFNWKKYLNRTKIIVVDIPSMSDEAILAMYEGIRKALVEDDALSHGQKKYGAREFPDWKQQANMLEDELDKRNIGYEKIDL